MLTQKDFQKLILLNIAELYDSNLSDSNYKELSMTSEVHDNTIDISLRYYSQEVSSISVPLPKEFSTTPLCLFKIYDVFMSDAYSEVMELVQMEEVMSVIKMNLGE